MFRNFLLVGLGGAFGSMLRYFTALVTVKYFHGVLPLATLIANVVGCFVIGLLMGAYWTDTGANHQLRLLLVTGFCGGFTTFSAFSYENVLLFNNNNGLLAAGYIIASILAGIGAVWIGLKIA